MLSVPRWAVGPVMELGTDHRRIEGLIAPGTFNIDPSASAETILATLISAGAVEYMKSGLVDTAKSLGLSPYDILVVASLVQQEANTQDFPKVARVIYNRLHEHRTLEFDSTVNYPLDRREVATSDTDRAQRTPWNTYMAQGLPATAICSPGVDALRAAEHPVPGDWLYFVTIDSQARRCSPGTISSIWRTSSWPNTTVSSTARDERRSQKSRRAWFADRAFPLPAAAPGRLPGVGAARLDL